jgi:hypothetical protein
MTADNLLTRVRRILAERRTAMKKLKTLTAASVVGLSLIGGTYPLEARTIQYRERSTGSFHDTAIDTNGDTIPATLSLLSGKTSVGWMTGETLGEFRPLGPQDTPTGECAAGTFEFTLVNGVGINRFDDGSILVLAPSFSVLCLDPITGTGVFINRGAFQSRGSTKRFEGASGSWETRGTAVGLVVGPNGAAVAGTINFELQGTLLVP